MTGIREDMLTGMITGRDWSIMLEVFDAAQSNREEPRRDDRNFLEAVHYFTVHSITWRALWAATSLTQDDILKVNMAVSGLQLLFTHGIKSGALRTTEPFSAIEKSATPSPFTSPETRVFDPEGA